MKLVVIAKEPRPGRAKTRLSPPCHPAEAAAIAEASLADTLEAVAATPFAERVLALDGRPGPWLPAGFRIVPQRGNGLGERLSAAFADTGGLALLIGMDTPQVTAGDLAAAAALLRTDGVGAVLGASTDGGWWALGLRVPDAEVFRGVPMSTSETCAAQRNRLHARGLRVAALPTMRDVDTFDDALAVAEAVPGSRFAHRVHQVARRHAPAGDARPGVVP